MPVLQIKLSISSAEFSRYYRGEASQVVCSASDGQTVQFPAAVLRPHLSHDGVHGTFEIEFSDQNQFIRIRKLN